MVHFPAKEDIGRLLGYFWCRVCRKSTGPKIRRFDISSHKLSPEEIILRDSRIMGKYKNGVRVKDLSLEYGVSTAKIYKILRSE
jgi:hypothetical protein